MPTVTLTLFPGDYAICRLAPNARTQHGRMHSPVSVIARTADELSVLCSSEKVPAGIQSEAGWRLFKFQGPFAFTQTGILSAVLNPLAEARVGILAYQSLPYRLCPGQGHQPESSAGRTPGSRPCGVNGCGAYLSSGRSGFGKFGLQRQPGVEQNNGMHPPPMRPIIHRVANHTDAVARLQRATRPTKSLQNGRPTGYQVPFLRRAAGVR